MDEEHSMLRFLPTVPEFEQFSLLLTLVPPLLLFLPEIPMPWVLPIVSGEDKGSSRTDNTPDLFQRF